MTSRVIELFLSPRNTPGALSPASLVLRQRIEPLLRDAVTTEQPSLAEHIVQLIKNSSEPLTDTTLHQEVERRLGQPSAPDPQKTYAQVIQQIFESLPPSVPNAHRLLPRARRDLQNPISPPSPRQASVRSFADALVNRGDRQLAIGVANSLVLQQQIAANGLRRCAAECNVTVPPDSTFGQAWAELADALHSEPFKSFAQGRQIDISKLLIDTSGTLTETKNNRDVNYYLHRDTAWASASTAVLAAARKVAGRGFLVEFSDRNHSDAYTVAQFYGLNPGYTKGDTLFAIGQLFRDGTFRSLISADPEYATQYAPIKQLQQNASQRIVDLPQPQLNQRLAAFAPKPVSKTVEEADRELALRCSQALMKLLPDCQDGAVEFPILVNDIPEYSTFNQVRNNLLNALNSAKFKAFLIEENLDPGSVRIAPDNAELTGKVNGVDTAFTLNDLSNWTVVWGEIMSAVQAWAAGSDAYVQYPSTTSARLYDVMRFYKEPIPSEISSRESDWQERRSTTYLGRVADMIRNKGFKALLSPSADDSNSQEVRKRQQAVIQQFTGQPAPLSPLETLAADVHAQPLAPVKRAEPTAPDANAATTAKAPPATAPQATTPTASSENPALGNAVAQMSRKLFSGQPNLRSVVEGMLGDAINDASPGLDFDVNHLAFATPDPDGSNQFVETQLVELALDYLANRSALPFLRGNGKFVDTRPDVLAHTGFAPGTPLALDEEAVNRAVSMLPAKLNEAIKAAKLEYWNAPAVSTPASGDAGKGASYSGSRQALIVSLLRDNLFQAALYQPGLTEEERDTLDMVLKYPVGSTRPRAAQGSLVEVYTLDGHHSHGFSPTSPNILIKRMLPGNTVKLMCEPSGKVSAYNDEEPPKTKVNDDIFNTQANIIINRKLGQLLATAPSSAIAATPGQPKVSVPDWLANAVEADRFTMHELALKLASHLRSNKIGSSMKELKDIRTFAQEKFSAQLPIPNAYKTEDLEVVFKVAAQVAGGSIERRRVSLTDVLLKNAVDMPSRQLEVHHKTLNVRIPFLEKDGALRKMVEEVDVGKHYPEYLKNALLDDPVQKAAHQAVFTEQVPITLQIKALEQAIRGSFGFDMTGFRYVREILDPKPGAKTVDGKEIAIRPLAFIRTSGDAPDIVANAYLIEPSDSEAGPHILYRPMSASTPLLQFRTRAELMKAIQKPAQTQKEIINWMSDDNTRTAYRNGGFLSPHTVVMGQNVDPLIKLNPFHPTAAAPTLATDGYAAATTLQAQLNAGQLMNSLYEANASAQISSAAEMAVTTEDSTSALHTQLGWLVLNAVLSFPLLPAKLAYAAYALQALNIVNDIETLTDGDDERKAEATVDLLVNLAILLIAHLAAPRMTKPAGDALTTKALEGRILPDGTPGNELAPRSIQLGGTAQSLYSIEGVVASYIDTYNGGDRINVLGHGSEPAPGQPSKIMSEDGKLYSAQEIYDLLLERGIDLKKFKEGRVLACWSASGGDNSFIADMHSITGVPFKGYEGPIVTDIIPGVNIDELYQEYVKNNRLYFPELANSDIESMAQRQLDNYVDNHFKQVDIKKDHGSVIWLNIGTEKNPVWQKYVVDYQPKRTGPPKAKAEAKDDAPIVPTVAAHPVVDVLMGESHTVQDGQSILTTRSLSDCSALVVLSDLKDGVYQKRTMMHLTGSNLEFGLCSGDVYEHLEALDRSLNRGGKVILVGGSQSQSVVGVATTVGQEYNGKKPLLDLLKKPGVEAVIAGSVGVTVKPDGTFTLLEGTGNGVFDAKKVKDVFDFAD
ncbi:DUF6543 domain-containing protein [Pseudomonas sp. W4I3]|uniref:DUF6543 domain-containing protein n=1 Tax=Pseudomonas sp. W4I3 TaxID=3042294 RepID=UPI0027BB1DE0|nr:DUF6543 domain-containing protein [Pseudomonas sp. W4I3]